MRSRTLRIDSSGPLLGERKPRAVGPGASDFPAGEKMCAGAQIGTRVPICYPRSRSAHSGPAWPAPCKCVRSKPLGSVAMDDFKDPVTPQPVIGSGAIDDATVPDRELENGADVLIFDPETGEL